MGFAKRRRGRRRNFRRRRRKRMYNNAYKVIVRGPHICPDSMYVKLPYNESFNVSASTNLDQIFRGNSLYDPNFSGAGHQPLGYDQLTSLYNQYTVMGCKVTLSLMSTSAAVTQSDVQMTLIASNDSGAFVSSELIAEQPYNKTRYMGNAYVGPRSITSYYSSSKITGVSKKRVMDDPDFSALYNNNPAKVWYVHCYLADLTADNLTATYKVTLLYYAKFWDRIKLTTS